MKALTRTLTLTVTLGCIVACTKPPASSSETRPGSDGDNSSASRSEGAEAAKARELQDKATAYEERYKAIQESDMTAEQRAQATSALVDEQQRTVREAEDGTAGEESPDQPQ